jgi:hypothetical protein
MDAPIEERFAKLSLKADGKSHEDTTRIILATVYPRPGKTERVCYTFYANSCSTVVLKLQQIIELYQPIILDGATKEPGCIQFQLFVDINPETGNEEIFTIEK